MVSFLELVLGGSLPIRGASRALGTFFELLGVGESAPYWGTGRWWLLRLGYYQIHQPKEVADDWVWLVDHATQAGVQRCLVILGIRQKDLPPPGQCLRHQDMEVIDVKPVDHSDKTVVYEQLERASEKTGVPRAIVQDHGGDLKVGTERFCEQHEGCVSIYDVAHYAASVLRKELEPDLSWKAFCSELGQCKYEVQQTELSFLAPPSQRSKARYMNLEPLLKWASRALSCLDGQAPGVVGRISQARLEAKLGWLQKYREPLAQWRQMQAMVDRTVDWVRRYGLYHDIAEDLGMELEKLGESRGGAQRVRDALLAYVSSESAKARAGERLPGSSEVIESCFGRLKGLEGEHQKCGFTSMVLALGAIVSERTSSVIREALTFCKTHDVIRWCERFLGETEQTKRCQLCAST